MKSSKQKSTRSPLDNASPSKASSGPVPGALIPPFALVRQRVSEERVADPAAEVRAGLRALPLAEAVHPGMRVAIGVGSRGISCIREVVTAVVGELIPLGAQPFLVPAMGSHGGGTADGQREVLESYGLSEKDLGVPILSSMEAIRLGEAPGGLPVFFDHNAATADGILLVNRVKAHTSFRGRWESGLLKMLAVGFGKEQGATAIHGFGLAEGIPAAARVILARMPVIAGVAIVENGLHQPARITVLPAARMEAEEPALLELARRLSPGIPFEPLDLLVLKEIGKDISGTGMDLNVVGMWRRNGGPVAPLIRAVAALDLTIASHGNATGVGHADFISRRLRDKVDLQATYTNCLAAGNLAGAKIPMTFNSDLEVIAAGLAGSDPQKARAVLVQNTLELSHLWVTPSLLAELPANPLLEQLGPLQALAFDAQGNLTWPSPY